MGENLEFQGPQNLDQDLSLELGLEVLPSSWREVRWEYHEMLAHVDHESWKLVAGGVIAALMRVWICPSLCGALCVLSNWILKIQRYCFLYSGILFEGQNSYTLDFSCNHIFTYNDYNSCCQRNELNTWYQILIPCSFFWLCSFEPQATLLKGNCLEWSWVSIDPNSKPFSSNKMTSVCMYLYICSLV